MTILTVVLGFLAKLFGAFINKTPSAAVEAEKAGAAQQSAADSQAALKTETAIAQAEAGAASTVPGVINALNKGSF